VGAAGRSWWRPALVALLAVAIGLGCGGEPAAVSVDPRTAPVQGASGGPAAPPATYSAPPGGYGGYYQPQAQGQQAARGNTPGGSAFASWVLSTDPNQQYILDAFVRDDRVLGVIVSPNMTRGQVQQAMGSLMQGMQRTFPNRSLEVIAYYLSGDELARMTFDAGSRQTDTVWRQ
jgi:hypothetical protein